ncbi:class I SAM-dependent methyltransferase [Sphingomonas sp. PR090111-T3T-6A]|uniref:class I SAM-dependent methyltransferase n=1 Tax=Sphingomonas sp. PR090111-T3T-6A TaxID=685778 RepID=UPI0003A510C9|nr:class I SAM-dependent methyltransferase [Sphingomonas sp. PR090111-T3T-6A]
MKSEINWRFPARNAALRTVVGEKIGDVIRVRAHRGCALHGPYLDLPAGRCTVRVLLRGPSHGRVRMDLTTADGKRTLASEAFHLLNWSRKTIEMSVDIPAVTGFEVRLFCRLGVSLEIEGVEIDHAFETLETLTPDRTVGFESSKTYGDKIASGFFDRYLSGPRIMEVGYKGYDGGTVPIVPQAIGVDVDYPGYDGSSFPFADESFDGIYSSHCFEHIGPWKEVLRDWYRLLRYGGHLVIVVPHQFLFERKRHLPSYFNPDHKRYYTSKGLLAEIEEAFEENSYRVRHLVENDKDFDYWPAPSEGSSGCYEIELVIEKIRPPYWHPDDGSVRAYPVHEFRTSLDRATPWSVDLDLSDKNRCLFWGPYVGLRPSDYVAEFHFDGDITEEGIGDFHLVLDVARSGERVAFRELRGDGLRQALQQGKVSLEFSNDEAGGIHEFRVFNGNVTTGPKLAFNGVLLDYKRPERTAA